MMNSLECLLLTDHVAEPVALFERRAFAAQHFGAIAFEPFLDLGRVGVSRRRDGNGDRLDCFAGWGTTGATRAVAVTGGARQRLGFAAGEMRDMQFLAAGGG